MIKPKKDCNLATVTDGPLVEKIVCIFVEFDDGDCIVELPDGEGLKIVHGSILRRWIKVKSVRNSKDLLGCPFCGGEAVLGEYDNAIYVDCTACDCSMGTFISDVDATKAWNKRAI